MIITLSPQRRDDAITVFKLGDLLMVNDVAYDFGQIPEGATLPASAVDCEYVIGNIDRTAGVLHLTLLMPTPANATQAMNFPVPIDNPLDGAIALPTDVIEEVLP